MYFPGKKEKKKYLFNRCEFKKRAGQTRQWRSGQKRCYDEAYCKRRRYKHSSEGYYVNILGIYLCLRPDFMIITTGWKKNAVKFSSIIMFS